MVVVEVQCPECGRPEVVRYGRQANGAQRYRCNNGDCERRIFLVRYHNIGWWPEVKRPMVDMALIDVGDLMAIERGKGTRGLRRPQITPVAEGGRHVAGARLSQLGFEPR